MRFGLHLDKLHLLETIVQILPLISGLGLVVLLYRRGLLRRYAALGTYIVVGVAAAVCLMPLRTDSPRFLLIYTIAEPVIWVLQYAVIIDLSLKGLRRYRGIRRIAAQLQAAALVVALGVIGFGSLVKLSAEYRIQMVHRSVEAGGLVGLGLLILAISFLPVYLPRNTYYYITGFATLFAGDALLLFLAGSTPHRVTLFAMVSHLIEVSVQVWWMAVLTPAGEAVPDHSQIAYSGSQSERERSLQHTLEELDQMLRRFQNI